MSIGILPNVKFVSRTRDVNSAQSAHFRIGSLSNNPTKRLKKGGDKSALAILKDERQLGCVLQDTEPPQSSSMLRKSPEVLGPIRRVRFTKATQRDAKIRENKGPPLGKIQVKIPHQQSLEDRSPEEIARQERCARGDAWKFAWKIYKLRKEEKATFYSPSEEWILLAESTINPRKESLW